MSGLSPSVWPHGRRSLGIRADSLAGGCVELVFAFWGEVEIHIKWERNCS